MKPCRVQRCRTPGWRMPPNTVSVTRPGPFGNPFRERDVRNGIPGVDDPVAEFERWLKTTTAGRDMAQRAREQLRGKNLACYCRLNTRCHADVLLRIANSGRAPAKINHAAELKYVELQIAVLVHCDDLKAVADLLLQDKKKAAVARLEGAVTKLERIVGNNYRQAKIAARRQELGLPTEDAQ